ncbi:tetraacyldisaccharide 4'-kinase [Phenylobacterium hankyongense]|uniref:Tetraacyldisaccharide 4'-kinase n=1 Tax=Phenylobacterium hankyongense TaxID=1813876 RepID=A0A328AZI1_9CAUL|nr:tetraacyldisaccharide 4'-kinase [Phenylobacterium hankyongense]RAK60007.1 tetraacyldisaccharide 4'-kinase [Phenylobacterium hankyongense]
MKLGTPRWWYTRDRRVMPASRALLTPVSWIWAAVTARRIARAQPVDPGVPVICIGNLTLGGTGKTPVVRAVAGRLAARGVAVHLLSRGYGGRLLGPVRVDPQVHTSADVGDEPLMLARDFPVWIARDRAAGAQAAAAAGAAVVVMDDGHQNPSLKKVLSLVVVDGETRGEEWPFGDGRVFPAGPMREPLAAGLARADGAVILLPADLPVPEPDLVRILRSVPVLCAHLQADAAPPSGPQLGFAGVGKPWKVERALKAAGCELADFAPFPDHVAYDEATLQRLAERAAQFGAGLVTTEKDWVRLPAAWRERVTPWPVRAVFKDGDALDQMMARVVAA